MENVCGIYLAEFLKTGLPDLLKSKLGKGMPFSKLYWIKDLGRLLCQDEFASAMGQGLEISSWH